MNENLNSSRSQRFMGCRMWNWSALFLLAGLISPFAAVGQTTPPAQSNPKSSAPGSAPPKAATQKRRAVVSHLEGFELAAKSSVNEEAIRLGAIRAIIMKRLVALAPELGRSASTTPTFFWRMGIRYSRVKFILADDNGIVFQAPVSGISFTYPKQAPALIRGKTYSWHLEAPLNDVDRLKSDAVKFQVLDAGQAATLEAKLQAVQDVDALTLGVFRAQVFMDERLWYDALDAWTKLIAKHPDNAELLRQRATLYAAIPVTEPESKADLKKAESVP